MQLFYTPEISGNNYKLSEEESKHCIRVLRKKEGDILHLTDGKGRMYTAEITDALPKACKLQVIEVQEEYQKRPYRLHMAVAPTKSIDRFEWFLEKATEIGVDEITPLICDNSERKVIKPVRLEKVLIAAMKQSLKAYKPILNPFIPFTKFIRSNRLESRKFIAHCYNEKKYAIREKYTFAEDACILIGPEGDFSQAEVELAINNKFLPVSLGNSRLRTETAGVVACHTFNFLNF